MTPIRPQIQALDLSGITKVTMLGLDDSEVLPLWFGESDLVTPKFIRDAATRALEDGKTFYTFARGIRPLRQAIADFHNRTLKLSGSAAVALERVTVPGAAMLAVNCALHSVVETGDNIVIISPIWPNIFQAAKIVGAEPRLVRLDEDWTTGRWSLDLDKLFAACDARTKAFFIASPGNPTGWMATAEEQKKILEFARRRGIAIISDEVYGTLVYDGTGHAPSFLSIAAPDDAVFVIGSFSKPWAMTGWRIGWLEAPEALGATIENLIQYSTSGVATFVQRAAVTAIEEGEPFLKRQIETARRGREIVLQAARRTNRIEMAPPDGAFYAFFRIEGVSDVRQAALDLVDEANVGLAPGTAFGPGGEGYFRLCFARKSEDVEEAMRRIETWLKGRPA
jgi:aspartate/methionine/tyrosine aminotransferase